MMKSCAELLENYRPIERKEEKIIERTYISLPSSNIL